jgi:hypothetical protein
MFIFAFLLSIVLLAILLSVVFFGGVAVGVSDSMETRDRLTTARRHAIDAERRMHNLTRETFIRISEAAERRQSGSGR